MYGIWCEVWGGVTGSRAAWLKEDGELALYYKKQDAEEAAHILRTNIANNPHRKASFKYTVREFK